MKKLIGDLVSKSYENKAPFWRAVAEQLNRPTRNHSKVNLYHLNKNTKSNDIVVVPGSVLGSGDLTKSLTVAALRFSSSAKEKIQKAKGQTLSINDLFEKKPKGKGVKIVG